MVLLGFIGGAIILLVGILIGYVCGQIVGVGNAIDVGFGDDL